MNTERNWFHPFLTRGFGYIFDSSDHFGHVLGQALDGLALSGPDKHPLAPEGCAVRGNRHGLPGHQHDAVTSH